MRPLAARARVRGRRRRAHARRRSPGPRLPRRSASRRGSRSSSRESTRSSSGSSSGCSCTRRPAARDRPRAGDRPVPARSASSRRPSSRARRSVGLQSAISPNERLQQLYHPWTSYVIVPLFALANAGIAINGGFLAHAYASPVTLGILFGYLAGKPAGVAGGAWLVTRLTRGRVRPPVGWAAVAGGGTIAGIGFTVSLLISSLAFHGTQLEQAKLGVLSAALLRVARSPGSSSARPHVCRGRSSFARCSARPRCSSTSPCPVDAERDHVRGARGRAGDARRVRRLRVPVLRAGGAGDPRAARRLRRPPLRLAAPAAQRRASSRPDRGRGHRGRGRAGRLLGDARPPASTTRTRSAPATSSRYAAQLGLDTERFADDLRRHAGAGRVAEDVDGADLSTVSGTPTFFVNGRRHYGAYDIGTLSAAVRAARARASIVS